MIFISNDKGDKIEELCSNMMNQSLALLSLSVGLHSFLTQSIHKNTIAKLDKVNFPSFFQNIDQIKLSQANLGEINDEDYQAFDQPYTMIHKVPMPLNHLLTRGYILMITIVVLDIFMISIYFWKVKCKTSTTVVYNHPISTSELDLDSYTNPKSM